MNSLKTGKNPIIINNSIQLVTVTRSVTIT